MFQSEQQYEQLLMQYKQLLQGAKDIAGMISAEDFDSAITLIKARESTFLNCKCIRNYLELTPVQQKEIDAVVEELKSIEMSNIKLLEKGKEEIQRELTKTQKSQKLQNAYDSNISNDYSGGVINIEK